MKELFEKLSIKSFDFCINLLLALIVLLIGFKIVRVLENYLKKEHKFSKIDPSAKSFIISLLSILLKALLFIVAATIVGIPMTSLITILGSCALAVGLALQGGLSNLAGGLMILIFKPFRVGDYIESNSKEGTVKSITMFYTTLTTVDNKEIQLPNGNLSNSNITNYTANKERRIDMEFTVSYDSKIDNVKDVISKVIDKNENVLKDKEVLIRLNKHGDNALIFVVRVWVKSENYWNTYFDIMEETKKTFDKYHIEIPYPQLDIHNK